MLWVVYNVAAAIYVYVAISMQELKQTIKNLGMLAEDLRRLHAERATNSMSAQAVESRV